MELHAIAACQVRWMIRRGMPEVMQIERRSFEYPWCEEGFIGCLRQRNCMGNVAVQGERILGFNVYEILKGEIHILNFAVDPSHRLVGVGRQLVDKLVGKLSAQRRQIISAEVRETNLDAQLFFRRMRFKATGIEREFYEETNEDAFRFEYQLRRCPREEIRKFVG